MFLNDQMISFTARFITKLALYYMSYELQLHADYSHRDSKFLIMSVPPNPHAAAMKLCLFFEDAQAETVIVCPPELHPGFSYIKGNLGWNGSAS